MSAELPLLAALFDTLPVGVVVLDAEDRVRVYNRAEEALAGRARASVVGRPFFDEVAPCLRLQGLAALLAGHRHEPGFTHHVEVTFPSPILPEARDVALTLRTFEADGASYALLLVEDVSRARAIDRMKAALQELLVHDLKNPLAVVVQHLALVRSDVRDRGDPELLESLDESLRAAGRLQRMILNLLDITRLETHEFPVSRAPTEVDRIVREVAVSAGASARLAGATVSHDLPERPVVARVDADLVQRTLENLVDNAVRHAKRIVVRARRTGETIELEVEDDGPGLTEARRSTIFERYGAGEPGEEPRGPNRGLGLTFVRLAARAHGGDCTVWRGALGGSLFRVVLPG